jgi:thioredoxin-related protein
MLIKENVSVISLMKNKFQSKAYIIFIIGDKKSETTKTRKLVKSQQLKLDPNRYYTFINSLYYITFYIAINIFIAITEYVVQEESQLSYRILKM